MNNYYIDPTFTGVSTGSITQPFKSFTALKTAGFTHPCAILIKRGTTLVEGMTFWQELYNRTGTLSTIGAYGQGENPKWFKPNDTSTHLYSSYTQNIVVMNIDFKLRNNQTNVSNGGGFIYFGLSNLTKVDVDVNVWVVSCKFKGSEMNRTAQKGGNKSVYITARSDAVGRVNKFGVRKCLFEDLAKGIQLQGCDVADDLTDNSKGTYYSRGVKVEDCSFIGMSNGAVCMNAVESLNSAYVDDDNQSVVRRCFYSSYRWDKYDGTTIVPDAVFWTYHANRVMFEDITGGGYQPTEADAEIIDFDGLSWDCVARGIVGFGNGASLLLISTDKQCRAKYTDNSSTYSEYDWYFTRRNGSGNNVLEFSYFFNDGVQRGYALPGGFSTACANLRITGYQYNVIIRNCTFIDSVSTNNKYLANDSFASLNNTSVTVDSCVFLYKYLTTANNNIGTTRTGIPLNFINCFIYSLSWPTTGATDILTYLTNTAGVISNLKAVDPGLIFFPTQPPSSAAAARKIMPISTSPVIGSGTVSKTTDYSGAITNDCWWFNI